MVEHGSLNREVLGSNPTDAVSDLGQVRLSHVAYKSLGMLLVYPGRMAVGVKPKEFFLHNSILFISRCRFCIISVQP